MLTEQQLIAGCLLDDRNTQRQLYDRYKGAMYTLAYRITGDFDTANDVLQDGFLEVFRHIGQFRGESTLGAWIKKIIIRKALRQKKSVVSGDIDEAGEMTAVDWGNDTINAAHLETAILALPKGFRTVFVLIEVEGYTHAEVAAMLEISEGTSKSQLHHAKRKLKKILETRLS